MFEPVQPDISLAGLPDSGGPPKKLVDWAASLGVRGVRLDATRTGFRPRELDRSARRDLAAAIRRGGIVFAGLDVYLPPEHFVEPAHVDRACGAIDRACEMVAEIGADPRDRIVATRIHADATDAVIERLSDAALVHGVRIADHAWPVRKFDDAPGLGVGIDPADVLLRDASPAKAAASAKPLVAARLSDADAAGRCVVGAGRLEVVAYAAALSVAGVRSVVIDLRSLGDPTGAAATAVEVWKRESAIPGFG